MSILKRGGRGRGRGRVTQKLLFTNSDGSCSISGDTGDSGPITNTNISLKQIQTHLLEQIQTQTRMSILFHNVMDNWGLWPKYEMQITGKSETIKVVWSTKVQLFRSSYFASEAAPANFYHQLWLLEALLVRTTTNPGNETGNSVCSFPFHEYMTLQGILGLSMLELLWCRKRAREKI